MGEFDDLLNTGNEILNEVNKAVSTGDYSNLGDSIRVQVQDAVKKATVNTGQNFSGRASAPRTVTYSSGRIRTPFFAKRVGFSRGIAKIVIGAIFAPFFGILALGAMVSSSVIGSIVMAAITAAFVFMIKRGVDDRKLLGEFNKYGRILGNAEYFAVNDLAQAAGERSETVLKNIKAMIKKDFLPAARIDQAETTVMLSQRAYNQYVNAELARQERERKAYQANAVENITRKMDTNAAPAADDKVSAIIKEGNEYLTAIRKINEAIPGDEMTEKLYQLENIMGKIFKQVERQPECADDLRKFMNYYLPTTTKLLNAYVDLDRQPEVGNNIAQTKREIEDAIDVINAAFENLLDSLFQDMAWDISSDISVMKTMMAQDGLTDDGIMGTAQASKPSPAPEFDTQAVAQSAQAFSAGGMQMQEAPAEQAQADGKVELKF
jgi:5-bromo-4-chloroindolyl phosphate hydrolysis protein